MSTNKSTLKEKFAKIKQILLESTPTPPVDPPADGTAYTLKDGTDIKVLGELKEGSQVVVVTADGQNPIPDGEYELADGTTITTTGGTISLVESKAAEGGMEMEAKMAEQDKNISTLTSAVTALTEAIGKLQTGFTAQKEATTQMLAIVEGIAESGAAEPASKVPNAFAKKVDTSEKMAELTAALKKIKESK
jgi:uncharacterized coiled-coil protein SlyX